MTKNTILENKLIFDERKLEHKYVTDFTTGFHYIELKAGTYEISRLLEQNAILFIIDGSCSFSYNQYINRIFFAGDMLFFPKSAMVTGLVLKDIKFVYMTYDTPESICDRLFISNLKSKIENLDYDFRPMKINYPIGIFINSLVYLITNGVNCTQLHEIKQQELFLIIRIFYSREQLAEFFYPIIGQSFNFKNFVLENHNKCRKLAELIELSNLCPNVFMRKFKNEFGISGYQWMLKQMCQKIQHKASQPDITIKEIMNEVGIENPSHFNRICKKHFKLTPKELITLYQSGKKVQLMVDVNK